MDENKSKKGLASEVFQWFEAILLAIVIATLIRGFVFERVKVDGPSMDNTLANGQNLFTYKSGYFFHPPQKGDIVVIIHQEGIFKGISRNFIPVPIPGEIDYIKRVIGLPGDTVDIKNGSVTVNGEKLEEPYVKGTTDTRSRFKYPITVEKNKVFVLGDNREHSSDSREFGFVDFNKIKGKAVVRVYPFKDFGNIYKEVNTQ